MQMFSDQQLEAIAAAGAYPWLVVEDKGNVLPGIQGKVFAMRLKSGAPTGHFVAESYDLLFIRNAGQQNLWTLRQKVNGGFNTLLTSAPTVDAWLVDGNMRGRDNVFFCDRHGEQVNVLFKGYEPRGTATATEVIDVDASPPLLQQIFAALQTQTASQKAALDESKAIFHQVQEAVHTKLGDMEGKVDALQRSRTETTTALLEQKDNIEQLQAQNETWPSFCRIFESAQKPQNPACSLKTNRPK
jgi:hypothetical protein